jgi:peptidoglycan/LPS O-acetylase OafA/YrhL
MKTDVQPMDRPRSVSLAYLRAFLTLLVVLHHSLLAYCSFLPPHATTLDANLLWSAFPVIDSQRWSGADLIVGFNDAFFMSLMFLISGVFVWPSLKRKGAGSFVRDRLLRLGIPFVLAAGLLAPLAYYASWLSMPPQASSFWHQWLALGVWPAGPAWFLWVLLVFGGVAALLYRFMPEWGSALGRIAGWLGARPTVFFLTVLIASSLMYLPMAAAFDPMRWIKAGPFFVQISRVLHYALYFFVGVGIGACGSSQGLFRADGTLARRWPAWVVLMLLTFLASIAVTLVIIGTLGKGGPGPVLATLGHFMFVVSCAVTSFAFLSLFTRFARKSRGVLDSLSANAYGIYLLHYACVTWLQLAMLHVAAPGVAKGAVVFAGAVALSWSLSAALRRIPAVARIV